MARQYDYRISSEIWCLEGARGFGSWAGEIWGCTPKSVKSVLDFGSRPGSGRVMSGSRSSRGRVEVESGSLEGLCSDFVNEHTPVRFKFMFPMVRRRQTSRIRGDTHAAQFGCLGGPSTVFRAVSSSNAVTSTALPSLSAKIPHA